jgi:hypothetical protein
MMAGVDGTIRKASSNTLMHAISNVRQSRVLIVDLPLRQPNQLELGREVSRAHGHSSSCCLHDLLRK